MSGSHTPDCCPFCGLVTQVPHETQQTCIAALHAEIGRVRDMLARLKPTGVPGPDPPAAGDHPEPLRLGPNKPTLL